MKINKPNTAWHICLLMCLFSYQLSATTIIPFDNYADMARAAQSVVLARVISSSEQSFGNNTHQVYEFVVESNVKGRLVENAHFMIKSLSFKTNTDLRFVVADDLFFEEGHSYMLAIDDDPNAAFKIPILLNYAILEKVTLNNVEYLVPTPNGKNAFVYPTPSGKTPEPLIEVNKAKFLNNLRAALAKEKEWNVFDSKADKVVRLETRAAPPGCIYLGNNGTQIGYRWRNNSSANPINVFSQNTGDLSLTVPNTAATYVSQTVADLNANYSVELVYAGAAPFASSCLTASGTATSVEGSANFITLLSALPPTGDPDKIIVVFNDPCNSITDQTNCSGTLGYGGAYFGSPIHTFNGEQWFSAQNGFVVVNNGVGRCLDATGYVRFLDHEMTHVLGMDHLDPVAYPGQNMNPRCCNPIGAKDRQCMDFAYSAQLLPVELTDFQVTADTDDKVNIQWTSSSEINHKLYDIERSDDGKNFKSLTQIAAKGDVNRAAQYNYIDERPYSGVSYYRLKMVDKNSGFEFSKTLAVTFKSSKVRMKFFPNPVQDNLQVYISAPTEENFNLDIFDITGKMVWRKTVNTASITLDGLIDTHLWAKGMYFIKLSNSSTVITEKIMKY